MKLAKPIKIVLLLIFFGYGFPEMVPIVIELLSLNPSYGFTFLACALIIFPILALSVIRKNKKRLGYKPPTYVALLQSQPVRDLQWETWIHSLDLKKPDQLLAICRTALNKSDPKAQLFSAALLDQPNVVTAFHSDPEFTDRAQVLSAFIKHTKTYGIPLTERFAWIKKITEATTPSSFATLLDELVWLLARPDVIPIIQKALTSAYPVLLAAAIIAAGRCDMQSEARDWMRRFHENGSVDVAIAQAFGLLSCNDFTDSLRTMLRDQHRATQIAAAESLGKKGSPSDIPALRSLISDDAHDPLNVTLQYAINLITKRFDERGQPGDLALLDPNSDSGSLSFADSPASHQPERKSHS